MAELTRLQEALTASEGRCGQGWGIHTPLTLSRSVRRPGRPCYYCPGLNLWPHFWQINLTLALPMNPVKAFQPRFPSLDLQSRTCTWDTSPWINRITSPSLSGFISVTSWLRAYTHGPSSTGRNVFPQYRPNLPVSQACRHGVAHLYPSACPSIRTARTKCALYAGILGSLMYEP